MRASVDVTLSARGSCRGPFLEAFKISCRGPFLDIVIILLLAHSYFSTKSASYHTVRRVRQNSGNEEILPVVTCVLQCYCTFDFLPPTISKL